MGSSRTRNSTRAGKARSAKPSPKPRGKPPLSPVTAAKPNPGSVSPFGTDSALARNLRRRLNLIHAVVMTVAFALERENAGHDGEFAAVLTRCAADPLWGVIADDLGGEDDDEVETGL